MFGSFIEYVAQSDRDLYGGCISPGSLLDGSNGSSPSMSSLYHATSIVIVPAVLIGPKSLHPHAVLKGYFEVQSLDGFRASVRTPPEDREGIHTSAREGATASSYTDFLAWLHIGLS